jgi:hypothetical protein
MKKVFAILIAVILLASGMQISLDRHYCGGNLADVKISVTGKLASCGMEKSESSCPIHSAIDKKCCEDQISFYSLNSNYFPEYYKLSHTSTERVINPILADNPIYVSAYSPDINNWVLPPGNYLKSGLTQSEICVFRI